MAQQIGYKFTKCLGLTETMYRLSRPLHDVAPDWRSVVVAVRTTGEREIYRGRSYQKADGSWSAIPEQQGSWRACFQPLTARDLALVENEIAAV